MNENLIILKFLKKYFQSDVFEKEGFLFEFKDVDILKDFENAYSFFVNVILPDPNQSYIAPIFEHFTQEIIRGAFDFLGQHFSYSITITIDGKELFSNTYMFIKKESLKKIIENCNERFDRIGISVDFGQGEKTLDMNCRFSWQKIPYELRNENCEFNFELELSNFELDSQKVVPNPEKINIVAGTLWGILVDRDWFTSVIEDLIYEQIIPETKIEKVEDIYAVAFFRVNKINGELVKQEDRFNRIQPDDFIEVS